MKSMNSSHEPWFLYAVTIRGFFKNLEWNLWRRGTNALPPTNHDYMQYFSRLLEEFDEVILSKEEWKERQIITLLLQIKCGTPPQRKTAMRQIMDKGRDFSSGYFHE